MATKPPIPLGAVPNPRHRKREPEKADGRKGVLDALSQIASAELSQEHIDAYQREIIEISNPRGAAILLAVHVESALEVTLERRLRIPRQNLANVFGFGSPMGTFDRKIRMAYAIRLLTDATYNNLDVVRKIRNAFAHAIVPLSFEMKEITAACDLLIIPAPLPPLPVVPPGSLKELPAREHYRRTCEITAHNLFVAAGFYLGLINRARGAPIPQPPQSV